MKSPSCLTLSYCAGSQAINEPRTGSQIAATTSTTDERTAALAKSVAGNLPAPGSTLPAEKKQPLPSIIRREIQENRELANTI
jgi:hypothetical protein